MNKIESLVDQFVKKGSKLECFLVVLPNGHTKKSRPGKEVFTIKINSPEVYREIFKKGGLGIGEQYMLGNIEILGNTYKALYTLLSVNMGDTDANALVRLALHIMHLKTRNTKHQSLKNIEAHYDLGNDFYKTFLDSTMSYSNAYFKSATDSLETAQLQKLEYICRKLQLQKNESLLDVGCGWGGLLIYAAQHYGVKGYGVTLSEEQYRYAQQQVKNLKLEKLVTIKKQDYRDVKGKFDKWVSVGMFEHVGKDFINEFFTHIPKNLKAGGIGLLHTSTSDIEISKFNMAWINTYIFPGGYMPSLSQIIPAAINTGLEIWDVENLRPHYNRTLLKWAENYEKNYEKAIELKGVQFARMWKFYLCLCAAFFSVNTTTITHYQVVFSNGRINNYPLTRTNLYK